MSKDKNIILQDTGIVVPDKAIVVVRSADQIAKAIMEAGPEFGKINKGAAKDLFKPFSKVR